MEARAALSRSGTTNLASHQSPVKMDVSSVPPVSGPPSTSIPSGFSHVELIIVSHHFFGKEALLFLGYCVAEVCMIYVVLRPAQLLFFVDE